MTVVQDSANVRFAEHGYDSPIVEVAFALASHRDNVWHASGTAVVIAPCLLLTARHVIDHHWRRFGNGDVPVEGEGHFLLYARHYHSSPDVGIVWTVTRFWVHQTSDLALLFVQSGAPECAGYTWKLPRLQLVPPGIGTKVAAFGYRESTTIIDRHEDSLLTVTWNEKPTTSLGIVTEIYPDRRDSVMLNFPSFQTDARFEPGMSGGPVFSDQGELVGIVCTGLASDGSDEPVSTATSIWPLMGLCLRTRLEGDSAEKEYSVRDLAARGIVHTNNLDKVLVTRNGKQVNTTLTTPVAG